MPQCRELENDVILVPDPEPAPDLNPDPTTNPAPDPTLGQTMKQ
jgi:hypothetical protein